MIKKFLKNQCQPLLRLLSKYYIYRKAKRYQKIGTRNSVFYRYAFAECGERLAIYGNPLIQKPELIHVGNNVSINEGAQINPNGKIYIGNNVTISSGVKIIANALNTEKWADDRLVKTVEHIGRDIHIADGTWLCSNSVVLPGVSIRGKGVIVAAGAVVTKDIVENFALVAGVPAKVVKLLN